MQSFFKRFILVLIFSFPCFFSFSQSIQIKYSGNRGYTLVERANLRRYVNGKYSGLTSREVRSFISAADELSGASYSSAAKPQYYSGNFYVMEETLRNSKSVAAGIHKAIPSVFSIDSDGQMKMIEDNGYPSFRSFPSYTAGNLKAGDSWKAKAERAADPLNKGVFTRMPINVLYTFSGEEVYNGEKVYRIKAIWQTNYGFSNFYKDPQGDDSLEKATGGHKADIIVRKSTGEAILINDSVDETFFYSGGTQVAFKGTITLFTEYPPAVDRSKLLMNLQRVASILPKTENQNNGKYAGKNGGKNDSLNNSQNDGKIDRQNSSQNVGLNDGKNVDKNAAQNDSAVPGGIKGGSGGKTEIASLKNGNGNETGSKTVFPENGSAIKKSGKTSGKDSSYLEKTSQKEKAAQTAQNDEGIRNAESIRNSENSRAAENIRNSEKESVFEKVPDIAETPKNNMLVEETSAGIRLSIRDIKFMPDSAQIVAGENSRLDSVASILKTVPNQLLIEGHTASVGKPAGEQKLSAERAEAIASELVKRGISADRLICKGLGGKNPVADNSTASGRAQNRRVEITILE